MLVVPWLIIGVAGLIFFSQIELALSLETIVLMHIVVTFPLVVAVVSAGLVRFNRSVEEAAIDLGASQWQMLRYVVLPQIAPSLAAAAIFAFAWSFNNFEISFFTGGFEQTFPVWVFGVLRHSSNLPIVNAASTVIAVVQVVRRLRPLVRHEAGQPRAAAAPTGDGRDDDRGGALMEAATVPGRDRDVAGERPSALRRLLRPLAFMSLPTAVLIVFFLVPMGILAAFSFQYGDLTGSSGFTLTNFTDILSDPLYRQDRPDHLRDRDDRDDRPADRRPAARLRPRLQGGQVRAAAAAGAGPRRRAQPDGPDLRLAHAARPRGADQLGADLDRDHRPCRSTPCCSTSSP